MSFQPPLDTVIYCIFLLLKSLYRPSIAKSPGLFPTRLDEAPLPKAAQASCNPASALGSGNKPMDDS